MDVTLTRAEQEVRRRLAVRKVLDGRSPADVAEFLDVHVETVRKWVRAYRAAGDDGLTATPHPGRAPLLTPDQQAQVLRWLTDRPTAHGFATDLWTARRVAELIRQKFGIAFNPNYLRQWLTKRGYSPQKPAKRAGEQKPHEINRWRAKGWPEIQKRGAPFAPTSC
jgi:transposase